MKKLITLLLTVVLAASCFFGCQGKKPSSSTSDSTPVDQSTPDDSSTPDSSDDPLADLPAYGEAQEGVYTYQDSVSMLSSSWNRLTYQTTDQAYPLDFMSSGLYSFFFNDDFSGYEIVPEMAAAMPVDVTEAVKAADTENVYGIPEGATEGYAYEIELNPAVKFHTGKLINATTWVESMKLMLDPALANYRGPDYFSGDFYLANASKFYNANTPVVYETVSSKGYKTNAAALEAGETLCLDMWNFWGLEGMVDENGNECPQWVSVTDETLYRDLAVEEGGNGAWVSAKMIFTAYGAYFEVGADYSDYVAIAVNNDNFGYEWEDGVGIYAKDDYTLVIVLEKQLAGFNLLYNLSGSWVVDVEAYQASLQQIEGTNAYSSNYGTSVETSYSYGPYKLVQYQRDKFMRFERNENWWGYTDGKHTYVDPVDGETYDMYMTDVIETRVVAEATTRKMMFMKGLLMGYGLQAEDYDSLRGSEYAYATPSETIFFFIFNGYLAALQDRESAKDFDKSKNDLETMTLTSFRKAVALVYDREKFASTISPARSGGYGLIGEAYLYDPENGLRYRDTDQAKKALCEFYSVDISKYETLDEAVDSITGYDPEKAKELFTAAFNEAIEKGYITDADNDGKCDQEIEIEYASSATSSFITKTLKYLNEELAKVLEGTPFEGKISFYESAAYGDDWSNKIREGMSDTVLGGWSGSALNPFGLSDLYVNPSKAYDANWFDPTTKDITIEVPFTKGAEKQELTMTLKQWSDALNGTAVTTEAGTFNFGEASADVETRLDILAAIEVTVLNTYDYIPMLQDGSLALLSKQVYYVVEEYNPVMGRGGITYLKYNYDDKAWADYVASQGGTLNY